MVTCTVAIRRDGKFWGAATIDLELKGLQAFVNSLQEEIGGYSHGHSVKYVNLRGLK
nr:hypothetical protein [Baaleninema simplex]